MQKLINLIRHAGNLSPNQKLNLIREYMQVLILKAIYQSKYGEGLSFMGGTCLRICYDLKRYSEDLDFTLDRKIPGYSFKELNHIIITSLKENGFSSEASISEDKTVQKSSIKITNLLYNFGISPLKDAKLHIKLEVDTHPVKATENEIESFFVTKFDEIYPILKHTDTTLFSGKIMAILSRPYAKGRDFYDLIWYLNRKTEINLPYLNKGLHRYSGKTEFKNKSEVIEKLSEKISLTDTTTIMKDVERFLEDSGEGKWIKSYPAVFRQISKG